MNRADGQGDVDEAMRAHLERLIAAGPALDEKAAARLTVLLEAGLQKTSRTAAA